MIVLADRSPRIQRSGRVSPLVGLAVVVAVAGALVAWKLLWRHEGEAPDAGAVAARDHGALLRQALTDAESAPQRALESLEQIPPEATEYRVAVRHVARIALLCDDFERAERALRVLERSEPEDFAVQLSLAELLHKVGRGPEALPYADRSAELRPEYADTYLLQAEILDDLARVDEMIAPLARAIELDPDRYEAHANMAYALHFAGLLDEAEQHARWCLERRPELGVVRGVLAKIERDRGNHDAALEEVRRALQSAPDHADLLILEADLLVYAGEYELAYARLVPLLPEQRHRRAFLAVLARAAQMSGREAEAIEYQTEMLSLIRER